TAREALIRRCLPLARSLAGRYARAGESLEDLVQVANIGLIKAVDRFDPTRGIAFSSFAVPSILGELKRHFRDHGWAARVPRPPPRAEQHEALACRGGPRAREREGSAGAEPDAAAPVDAAGRAAAQP